MGRKFCPKCGKETEEFFENLCGKCFLETLDIDKKLEEKLQVKMCRECGKFFLNNLRFDSLGELIQYHYEKIFKKEKFVDKVFFEIDGRNLYLTIKMKAGKDEREVVKEVRLMIKKILCKTCWMKKTGYHQGILQVRGKIGKEVQTEIERIVETFAKRDPLAFISGFEQLENGFDMKIGSQKLLMYLASFLKRKYGAKIKISKKLTGMKRGKRVYKVTVSARLENG